MFEILKEELKLKENKDFEKNAMNLLMEGFDGDEEDTEFVGSIENDDALESSDDTNSSISSHEEDEIDELMKDIDEGELDSLLEGRNTNILEEMKDELDLKYDKEDKEQTGKDKEEK